MQRQISIRILLLLCLTIVFPLSAISQKAPEGAVKIEGAVTEKRAAPENDTGKEKKSLVRAEKYMIVTANKHATEAGNNMLKQGGSAVDAMIAAQLVLSLVEPQSSGIGGGAFLLHWDKKKKELLTYDGRETAPASAKPDHFLDQNKKPLEFHTAIKKGLGVGVPGIIRLLETSHKAHGKLPWATLFAPAIKLAENGFEVSPRLHKLLTFVPPRLFGKEARSYFYDEQGKPRPVGYILKNPQYAETLKVLAKDGASAFYKGPIAEALVKKVAEISDNKNGMTLNDLSSYVVKKRDPVCVTYRKRKVCGMGPPSSGALTIGQVLKLIEPYNLRTGPTDHQVLHYIAEAQKLAYADRAKYMADSDFIPVPKGLLDKKYLDERRKLIIKNKTMKVANAGKPPLLKQGFFGKDATKEMPGTSHLSIVDAEGNAVSMTTSIETAFGSKYMVGGFLLNNQLTDFSFKPADANGVAIANRIEGGKRPRSSMSPTIVFDRNDNLILVVGSPGGSRIILYVLKTIIAMVDWGLDQQAAVALANFGSRNGPFELEAPGKGMTKVFLKAFGHKVYITDMNSGLHVILKSKNMLYSGIDPRREGTAMGE